MKLRDLFFLNEDSGIRTCVSFQLILSFFQRIFALECSLNPRKVFITVSDLLFFSTIAL